MVETLHGCLGPVVYASCQNRSYLWTVSRLVLEERLSGEEQMGSCQCITNRHIRQLSSSMTICSAAAAGESACVTGRPITNTSAPWAIASPGVATLA